MAITCACQTVDEVDHAVALETLATIRDECPVLSDIILPNSVWPWFEEWHRRPDEVAWHCSVTLLALQRQCLNRVTSPIHRFLFDGNTVLPTVSQNYTADLRERWVRYADPTERHQKSRMFRGRVVELQYASWLEDNGHRINALEALGGSSDIVTVSPDGAETAVEVKFIGVEDGDFITLLEAIAVGPTASVVSPYAPLNYLLFRAYEAAKQLGKAAGRRIVTVIIDGVGWDRFQMQLEDGWIDWAKPHFMGEDAAWATFLDGQKTRYPGLPDDLAAVLHSVDAVWILTQSGRFEFSLVYELKMPGA